MRRWARVLIMVGVALTAADAGFSPKGHSTLRPKKNIDYMGIHIIDQRRLSFGAISGVPFGGISDLNYDPKSKTMLMVSDRGALYDFQVSFGRRIHVKPRRAAWLRGSNGVRFAGADATHDSEGLAQDGRGNVLISFEGSPSRIRHVGTRGARFGRMYSTQYSLPSDLKKSTNYVSNNRALEAVAWHPKYGLLTAAENPTRNHRDGYQRIYSLSGKVWAFRPEKEINTGIVSMAVMDDGNLLVLERAFIRWNYPFVVTLKKVYLKHKPGQACRTKVLAKMDMHSGWWVDNYEGLTKVGKNRYVMVSDDDFSWYRPTLMMYFEVR